MFTSHCSFAGLFTLVFSFLVALTANALGAVLTVGPNGTYGSIQEAIDVAIVAGGDNEVRVQRSFTYVENLVIPSSFVSGTLDIIGGWNVGFGSRSENPALTVIDGGAVGRVLSIQAEGGRVPAPCA